jgi:DNA-binding response OmpR family regulator
LRWQIALPLPRAKDSDLPIAPQSASLGHVERRTPLTPVRPSTALTGKRFLVVEDEPLIALDIVPVLERAGAEVAGPVGIVDEALFFVEKTKLDAALLDANLRGQSAVDIASALTRASVPFLFVTGYDREALPPGFGKAPVLAKPFSQDQLIDAAVSLVRRSPGRFRLRD